MSPVTKKIVDFKAKVILGNDSYPGNIKNISEDDIFLVASPIIPSNKVVQGSELKLRFSSSSSETFDLNCKIKCSYKTPPHGMTNSMIIEVSDPSMQYKNFLRTL